MLILEPKALQASKVAKVSSEIKGLKILDLPLAKEAKAKALWV